MTLSVRRAINKYTGFQVRVQQTLLGQWDSNNQWVPGGLSEAVPVWAVVKPIGVLDHEGIYGNKLDARPEGERLTEHLEFLTREGIPMRSIVTHGGRAYKIVRVGDYKRYGYQTSVGRWGEGEDES